MSVAVLLNYISLKILCSVETTGYYMTYPRQKTYFSDYVLTDKIIKFNMILNS